MPRAVGRSGRYAGVRPNEAVGACRRGDAAEVVAECTQDGVMGALCFVRGEGGGGGAVVCLRCPGWSGGEDGRGGAGPLFPWQGPGCGRRLMGLGRHALPWSGALHP